MKSSFTLKSLPRRTSKVLFTLPSTRLRRTGKATCCPAHDRVDPFLLFGRVDFGHKIEYFSILKALFLHRKVVGRTLPDHKDSLLLG